MRTRIITIVLAVIASLCSGIAVASAGSAPHKAVAGGPPVPVSYAVGREFCAGGTSVDRYPTLKKAMGAYTRNVRLADTGGLRLKSVTFFKNNMKVFKPTWKCPRALPKAQRAIVFYSPKDRRIYVSMHYKLGAYGTVEKAYTRTAVTGTAQRAMVAWLAGHHAGKTADRVAHAIYLSWPQNGGR